MGTSLELQGGAPVAEAISDHPAGADRRSCSSARPIRVNASTTTTTHRPGGRCTTRRPAVIAPLENAWSRIEPHDGAAGRRGRGSDRVVSAEDGDRDRESGVGQHQRHHVGQDVPAHLVAVARHRAPGTAPGTAGPSTDRVWARISRAVPGHDVTPMTTMMLTSERAEHRGQDDRQRQERDHQEPVGEPVEQRPRPAAEVAGR